MRLRVLLVGCVLLSGACSGGPPAPGGAPNGASGSVNASKIARTLESSVASAGRVVTITEDNDPNDLIGRPNGYKSAAVVYDKGANCAEELGVSCGATVEVWPSSEEAKVRSDYIQGLLKATPLLGSEYNYLDGPALLRVSGELKPTIAKKYEAAFAVR